MKHTTNRRKFVKYTVGVSGIAVLAGCNDEGAAEGDDENNSNEENDTDENTGDDDTDDENAGDDENQVIVAPDGDWRFDPEELTITVGETVTWYFDAPGHNVTSHPDANNQNENPEDAEPFTSYEGDNHSSLVEEGEEFEHTFEEPGEYVYVCQPHPGTMVGTIIVEE